MVKEHRTIYWRRRRRHHPPDAAPKPTPTPIYTPGLRARGSTPLPPPERRAEGRGTPGLSGGDRRKTGRLPFRWSRGKGTKIRFYSAL
jgi:hypothetical protein